MKKAVIYCRVSTDEQADKGYSLPTQMEACERYAHSHGFEIVGIYKDDYTGAVPLESRPEGRKAYDLLRNGAADVLIAYRIDRIVRPPEDGDEWDMPVLIRGLAKLGRGIRVCNRGELKTDFASLLIAMLDARKAGEERRDIVERTKRGRDRKAREGKVVGNGITLYGYKKVGDTFEIVESEAKIVRMIFKMYNDGMTDWRIATELSKLGIQTPGEARGRTVRKIPPGVWLSSSIRDILIHEAYAGTYRYGRLIGKGGKGGKRPPEQHIPISIPAVVSRDEWQAAQARREYNKQMSARNTKHDYLLRGMVKCHCGRTMSAQMKKGGPWYRCCSYVYHHAGLCNERAANGKVLDAFAWAYALNIILDREKLLPRMREAQAAARAALQPLYERLEAISDDIVECEKEAAQVAAAMGSVPKRAQATSVVFRQLQLRADELDKRFMTQCGKRDNLQAEISAAEITDESILNLTAFSDDAVNGLTNPSFAEKRRWLEYLRIKIVVKDHKATAACALKVESRTIDLGTSSSSSTRIVK